MAESALRNKLRSHLEEIFGIPSDLARARQFLNGKKAAFDIYRFEDVPYEGAITLCSIGMSEAELQQPDDSLIRNEILFATYPEFLNDDLYNLLFQAGTMFVEEQRAITLGHLMELEEPVAEGSLMEALLFYSPVYFPEEIYKYAEVSPPVVYAWAIPVTRKEMIFIEENGHEAFSELLEATDPDLLDLHRESVV